MARCPRCGAANTPAGTMVMEDHLLDLRLAAAGASVMVTPGDTFTPGDEPVVAQGVRAFVFDTADGVYIPWIAAEREGAGDVGRYLDALPRDRRVVFPTVLSRRLAGMLRRRGFCEATEYVEELGEHMDIFERQAQA